MEPTLSYARTSDGVTIAYASIGEGPALVWMPSLSNLVALWRVPVLREAYEQLARSIRLLMYDGRGTGRSQRDVDLDDLGLDAQIRDLDAVTAHAGIERFAIIGLYHAVPAAIIYAARNPRRVTRLVLFAGSLRNRDSMNAPQTQALLSLMERDWDLFAESAAHAWMGWEAGESGRLMAESFRTAATPAVARATFEASGDIDASADVDRATAPALVLHRQAEAQIPEDVARGVAEALPNGKLALLAGSGPMLFLEDIAGDVDVVTRFLTDAPAPAVSPAPSADGLTPRELDVLRLVASGESNAEIAHRLGVSVHTVERHAANLYRKIDARGRADATAYAVRRGIV